MFTPLLFSLKSSFVAIKPGGVHNGGLGATSGLLQEWGVAGVSGISPPPMYTED